MDDQVVRTVECNVRSATPSLGVLRLHTSPRSVVITETKIQSTSRKICSNTSIMQRKRWASTECLIALIFLLRAEFSRKKNGISKVEADSSREERESLISGERGPETTVPEWQWGPEVMRLVWLYSGFVSVSPGQALQKSVVKSRRKNETDICKKDKKKNAKTGWAGDCEFFC